jgi:hypothetical protein
MAENKLKVFIDDATRKITEGQLNSKKKQKEENISQIKKHEQKIAVLNAENMKLDIDIEQLEKKLSDK